MVMLECPFFRTSGSFFDGCTDCLHEVLIASHVSVNIIIIKIYLLQYKKVQN